jgi:homoserine acetyltransferase
MQYGFIYAIDPRFHWHQGIHGSEGGMNRSTWAQKYPKEMCEAIILAIKAHVEC